MFQTYLHRYPKNPPIFAKNLLSMVSILSSILIMKRFEMNTAICLHNATVITGFSVMENCAVYIKNNRIADVFSERRFLQKQFNPKVKIINVDGAYIAPGFIDSHIHGIGGYGTDYKCLKFWHAMG